MKNININIVDLMGQYSKIKNEIDQNIISSIESGRFVNGPIVKQFSENLSRYFLLKLNKIQEAYPNIIKSIRGKGFLIGIQLYNDQTYFIKKLLENRLLTIRASENVIRILPPLNVKKNELDQALKIINKVCKELN